MRLPLLLLLGCSCTALPLLTVLATLALMGPIGSMLKASAPPERLSRPTTAAGATIFANDASDQKPQGLGPPFREPSGDAVILASMPSTGSRALRGAMDDRAFFTARVASLPRSTRSTRRVSTHPRPVELRKLPVDVCRYQAWAMLHIIDRSPRPCSER